MLNKIFNLSLLFGLFSALCLTACTDDLSIDSPDPVEKPVFSGEKQTGWFSFSLNMVDGSPYTRAQEDEKTDNSGFTFEDGSIAKESKISNILIIFYDASGNYLAHFDSEELQNKENSDEIPAIEKIQWNKAIEVQVDYYTSIKDKIFDSFFVIVNYDATIRAKYKATTGSDGQSVETCINRDALLNATMTAGSYETANGFIMTTPGHYDTGGNFLHYEKLSQGKKLDDVIFNSRSKATNNPVSVYVERLAARVDVEEIQAENISGVKVLYGTDVYELTFTPQAWGLEAEEKTEYLSKHAPNNNNNAYTSTYYPQNFYDWLNYTDVPRSFWAQSPSFISDNNLQSGTTTNKYPSTGTESDLTLKYTTFKDLKEEFATATSKGSAYTTERTFSASELKCSNVDNPYAVPTSFVLKGKYETAVWKGTDQRDGVDVDHDGVTIEGNKAPTSGTNLDLSKGFYLRDIDMERTDKEAADNNNGTPSRYQYRLYLEDNGAQTGPKDDLYIAMVKEQHVIFVLSQETYTYTDEKGVSHPVETTKYLPVKETTTYSRVENGQNKTYTIKAADIFTISNTKHYWTGTDWVTASNTHTLQLKDTYTDPNTIPQLYYAVYNATPEENATTGKATYTPIGNKATANEALQKQLGYAQRFYKGMAFFYSPITHYSGEGAPFSASNPYKGLFNYQTTTSNGVTSYVKDSKGRYIPDHKTGDFGVVRNHIYNFKVTGISSLGFGIPDEEVIPLPEPRINKDIYQFDLELKILPWNLFEYTLDI